MQPANHFHSVWILDWADSSPLHRRIVSTNVVYQYSHTFDPSKHLLHRPPEAPQTNGDSITDSGIPHDSPYGFGFCCGDVDWVTNMCVCVCLQLGILRDTRQYAYFCQNLVTMKLCKFMGSSRFPSSVVHVNCGSRLNRRDFKVWSETERTAVSTPKLPRQ